MKNYAQIKIIHLLQQSENIIAVDIIVNILNEFWESASQNVKPETTGRGKKYYIHIIELHFGIQKKNAHSTNITRSLKTRHDTTRWMCKPPWRFWEESVNGFQPLNPNWVACYAYWACLGHLKFYRLYYSIFRNGIQNTSKKKNRINKTG